MRASELSQDEHDAKAAAEAQAYKEPKSTWLKGEEVRAAQGQAAAAALNAGAAARRLAEAEAAEGGKIANDIAAGLSTDPNAGRSLYGPSS